MSHDRDMSRDAAEREEQKRRAKLSDLETKACEAQEREKNLADERHRAQIEAEKALADWADLVISGWSRGQMSAVARKISERGVKP